MPKMDDADNSICYQIMIDNVLEVFCDIQSDQSYESLIVTSTYDGKRCDQILRFAPPALQGVI